MTFHLIFPLILMFLFYFVAFCNAKVKWFGTMVVNIAMAHIWAMIFLIRFL